MWPCAWRCSKHWRNIFQTAERGPGKRRGLTSEVMAPTIFRRTRTLDALQALRATAALLVVADHAIANLVEKVGARGDLAFASALGDLGVTLFFGISGFVMILAHGRDFGDATAPRRFYLRRIGRILPLYVVITLAYAAKLAFEHKAPSAANLMRSLLFIPYRPPDAEYGHPVVGQGWTLNYEMVFYLVFGAALVFSRGVILVAVTFAVLVTCGTSGLFHPESWLGFWSKPIVLFFLVGILVGLLREKVRRGPGFSGAMAMVTVLVLAGILSARSATIYALAGAVSVAGCILVCGLAREGAARAWPRRVAEVLGDATYSIYLTHTFVVAAFARLAARFVPGLSPIAFVVLMLPATALVGLLVYRTVERPLIAAWAALFGAWQSPAVGEARSESLPPS